MTEWQNKRQVFSYVERDDGLKVFPRCFSDEQMRVFDRHVDSTSLSPEKKHLAKRVLRKMQGLDYDESAIDPEIVRALRHFIAAVS